MNAAGWRGLTWDHPRGYRALEAAARRAAADGLALTWDRHPLEGFEAHPIAELCARYDLVVLDHPHVGEAVAAGCLKPIEDLFGADDVARWDAECIGATAASYAYAGRHWALPLDAATQVMARRPDLVDTPPATWEEVCALAERQVVALSLAGPHAILSFQSICAAVADSAARPGDDEFVERGVGREAYRIMTRLVRTSPQALRDANPIALLEHIASGDGVALCPLVYGYVNYASRGVAFSDAPRAVPGGRPGSILGGTGIGISQRAKPSPALLAHLRWLLSDDAQCGFIPQHEGQPARRSAWQDAGVNAQANGFYAATRETLEQATLRPRHDGAVAFQAAASARLREGLFAEQPAHAVLDDLQPIYERHHAAGAET
ncbi:MAG TPA: extracellular solute-binding protein [Woeseiaceae bacterium]|nr:extracellular solute-binding protein [Woeseiaceae bacterium]